MEITDEVEDLQLALDQLAEWMPTVPKETTALLNAVYDQRVALELRYLEALAKADTARLIADGRARGGRREYPNLSPEQAEELALAMMRPDAFNDARAILEDLPEEAFRQPRPVGTLRRPGAGTRGCECRARARQQQGMDRRRVEVVTSEP
jgi:hypothetical protein